MLDDLFLYGHQNPRTKGGKSGHKRVCRTRDTSEISIAVQKRCVTEGIASEIPVGAVKIPPTIDEVSADGKGFKVR